MGQIDPARDSEPERGRPFVDHIDVEHVAQRVEVGVAGLLQGFVEGHRPVRRMAAEEPVEEPTSTATGDLEVGRDQPLFERGGRHDDLEGRARGVATLQGTILERSQRVGIQRAPGFGIDAQCEIVRVVGGQAHHRQHISRPRVEHDSRSRVAFIVEGLLRGPLEVVVERQLDLPPRVGWHLVNHLDLTTHAVDDHVSCAVLSHQEVVVALF